MITHLPISFPQLRDLEPVPFLLCVVGVSKVVVPVLVDIVGDVHAPGLVLAVDEDGGDPLSHLVIHQKVPFRPFCLAVSRKCQYLRPTPFLIPRYMPVDFEIKTNSELWTPALQGADRIVLFNFPR